MNSNKLQISKITTVWCGIDHTTIIATTEDKPVGTCMVDYAKIDEKHTGEAFLWNLWVNPDHRNMGVASKLMAEAREDAIERKCDNITLEWCAVDTDGWTLDWYKRMGYKVANYHRRNGCITMVKTINKRKKL